MNVLVDLIPVSLILGVLGLIAFSRTLRSRQFDDADGDSWRILTGEFDDQPKDSDR